MSNNKGKPSMFVGDVFYNKTGDRFELVEYVNAHKIRLKALLTDNDQVWTNVANVKKGNMWDPMKPAMCGVGYMGIGPYRSKHNRVSDEAYNRWKNMIFRCYDQATQEKYPHYVGCSVHPSWHCFQNYAHWYYNNPFYHKDWHVDKDLLIFGNREYGPDTCVLLPPSINSALQMRSEKLDGLPQGVKVNKSCVKSRYEVCMTIGNKKTYIGLYKTPEEAYLAFKTVRESNVREIVSVYSGQIDPIVYEKLMNFKVEDYGR